MGATAVAATVDDRDPTDGMARQEGLSFPIAYGMTQGQLEAFDPWWANDLHGHYPQPMEFLILRGGTIFGCMYASGPIGRMDVDEVITALRGRERRRSEQAQP